MLRYPSMSANMFYKKSTRALLCAATVSGLIQFVAAQGLVSNISLTYSFINEINLRQVQEDFSREPIHGYQGGTLIGLGYEGVFDGGLFHLSLATSSLHENSLNSELTRFTRFRFGFGNTINKKKRFQMPLLFFVGGHTYRVEPRRFGGWNFGLDWSAQFFITNKLALKGGLSGAFSYISSIDGELAPDRLWGRNYNAYAGILVSFYRQNKSKK